jgi:hypothetical protein
MRTFIVTHIKADATLGRTVLSINEEMLPDSGSIEHIVIRLAEINNLKPHSVEEVKSIAVREYEFTDNSSKNIPLHNYVAGKGDWFIPAFGGPARRI